MQEWTGKAKSVIIGCGGYLPEKIVTNHDLSKVMDTSHDWIVERSGIHQRHFAAPDQMTSDLAVLAAKDALEMAGIGAEDLDLIIVATTTPDYVFPSTATRVQDKLGNKKGLAFDVSAVCAGYLVALNVADNYIRLGQAKHVLVIGAEVLSRLLDMKDRTTAVLFADGAGAVVLKAEDPSSERGIMGIHMQSDGSLFGVLHANGGISSTGSIGTIHMEGQELFRHAVVKLAESAESTLAFHQVSPDQLDWLIPHQANIRIIEGMAKKLSLSMEKVITTVQHHANTSAASIPLALNHAVKEGKIKPGDMILHEAIGGGLVWGSALLRF